MNALLLFSGYAPQVTRSAARSAYFQSTILQYVLLIASFLVTLIASGAVRSAMNRYSNVPSSRGINGLQAATEALRYAGISNVSVEAGSGTLTDHYNPSSKKVVLGQKSYARPTVTAVAVAAHECGHAMQDAEGYGPLRIRTAIVPVANAANHFSWILILIGLILSLPGLTTAGVALFSAVVVFQLITLPVEFNASSRALRVIRETGMLNESELAGARKVLNAAAMTYVAALASSVMTLLRLFLMTRGNSRRR